jgi:hypothetical protein
MPEFIVCLIIGVLICFFGVRNIMGDISSLHDYHRKRVSPEDVKPFGRLVGIGNLIMGVSVVLMGVFSIVGGLYADESIVLLGTVIMAVGIVVGCAISFYAMKKYNGGIF